MSKLAGLKRTEPKLEIEPEEEVEEFDSVPF